MNSHSVILAAAAFALAWLAALPGATTCLAGEPVVNVIPMPRTVRPAAGEFELTAATYIRVRRGPAGLDEIGRYLAEILKAPTGLGLPVRSAPPRRGEKAVSLEIDAARKDLGDEGYALEVAPGGVTISAPAPGGVFHGVQTFRQLLPPEVESRERVRGVRWRAPCVAIEDSPRFSWRGMMLDPGRHFLPKEFVLKYIDELALLKLNRLHIHLTEDQGWRIEVRRYPDLSRVSAWRGKGDRRQGGFYSQADVKEIVAYAASRHVMVIPEIEMPGHSRAALAAFPELGCTGGPYEVSTKWGVHEDVYCAGNDRTFEFLENVLAEVVELFPAPYVHIGGDECPKDRWKQCQKCQARIKVEGLKDEHELQSWFIRRMEKYLNSKKRRIIGWDEILEGGLAPDATVQSWRGMGGGIAAARSGHDVIMSPTSHCYFDYYQGPAGLEPKAIGGYIPLEKIYSFEPVPRELDAGQARHVLGLQGNVWGEYVATPEYAEYMSWPRGAALAEVGWSPADARDVNGFVERLEPLCRRFELMGVNFRRPTASKRVGGWVPARMSETWKVMDWDLSPHLKKPGKLEITFSYVRGAHRLDIEWAALLEDAGGGDAGDGKDARELSRDAHHGITGARHENNTYVLELLELRVGARYVLRASVRSDGGTDSTGDVWLRTLPAAR